MHTTSVRWIVERDMANPGHLLFTKHGATVEHANSAILDTYSSTKLLYLKLQKDQHKSLKRAWEVRMTVFPVLTNRLACFE